MKLSMWMIANRLSPLLEIKTFINANAQPVLKSARLAYATNCVHVYPDGDHVVYAGEGDRILIYNLSFHEAFEILQGVFDYYQDWEAMIQKDLEIMDFQSLIDHSWLVFQNPLVILDANNKVLGMTNERHAQEVDPEWDYLRNYGYSSLKSVRQMLHDYTLDFNRAGYQSYHHRPNSMVHYNGMSCNLRFQGHTSGYLTLLAQNRELNIGDAQLLKKLADQIAPLLDRPNTITGYSYSIFKDMILGNSFQETDLPMQLEFRGWKETDTFQLALLEPLQEEEVTYSLRLIRNTLSLHFPDGIQFLDGNRVVFLSNRDLSNDPVFTDMIRAMDNQQELLLGFSLPVPGTDSIPQLLRQASSALDYGRKHMAEEPFHTFYDCGIEFMLNTPSLKDKIQACHPGIRKLWQLKREQNSDYYDTLKAYLDNERSLSRTAASLYAHRNTILYRLNKCWDYLPDHFDSVKFRYYIRLSMFYVEESL